MESADKSDTQILNLDDVSVQVGRDGSLHLKTPDAVNKEYDMSTIATVSAQMHTLLSSVEQFVSNADTQGAYDATVDMLYDEKATVGDKVLFDFRTLLHYESANSNVMRGDDGHPLIQLFGNDPRVSEVGETMAIRVAVDQDKLVKVITHCSKLGAAGLRAMRDEMLHAAKFLLSWSRRLAYSYKVYHGDKVFHGLGNMPKQVIIVVPTGGGRKLKMFGMGLGPTCAMSLMHAMLPTLPFVTLPVALYIAFQMFDYVTSPNLTKEERAFLVEAANPKVIRLALKTSVLDLPPPKLVDRVIAATARLKANHPDLTCWADALEDADNMNRLVQALRASGFPFDEMDRDPESLIRAAVAGREASNKLQETKSAPSKEDADRMVGEQMFELGTDFREKGDKRSGAHPASMQRLMNLLLLACDGNDTAPECEEQVISVELLLPSVIETHLPKQTTIPDASNLRHDLCAVSSSRDVQMTHLSARDKSCCVEKLGHHPSVVQSVEGAVQVKGGTLEYNAQFWLDMATMMRLSAGKDNKNLCFTHAVMARWLYVYPTSMAAWYPTPESARGAVAAARLWKRDADLAMWMELICAQLDDLWKEHGTTMLEASSRDGLAPVVRSVSAPLGLGASRLESMNQLNQLAGKLPMLLSCDVHFHPASPMRKYGEPWPFYAALVVDADELRQARLGLLSYFATESELSTAPTAVRDFSRWADETAIAATTNRVVKRPSDWGILCHNTESEFRDRLFLGRRELCEMDAAIERQLQADRDKAWHPDLTPKALVPESARTLARDSLAHRLSQVHDIFDLSSSVSTESLDVIDMEVAEYTWRYLIAARCAEQRERCCGLPYYVPHSYLVDGAVMIDALKHILGTTTEAAIGSLGSGFRCDVDPKCYFRDNGMPIGSGVPALVVIEAYFRKILHHCVMRTVVRLRCRYLETDDCDDGQEVNKQYRKLCTAASLLRLDELADPVDRRSFARNCFVKMSSMLEVSHGNTSTQEPRTSNRTGAWTMWGRGYKEALSKAGVFSTLQKCGTSCAEWREIDPMIVAERLPHDSSLSKALLGNIAIKKKTIADVSIWRMGPDTSIPKQLYSLAGWSDDRQRCFLLSERREPDHWWLLLEKACNLIIPIGVDVCMTRLRREGELDTLGWLQLPADIRINDPLDGDADKSKEGAVPRTVYSHDIPKVVLILSRVLKTWCDDVPESWTLDCERAVWATHCIDSIVGHYFSWFASCDTDRDAMFNMLAMFFGGEGEAMVDYMIGGEIPGSQEVQPKFGHRLRRWLVVISAITSNCFHRLPLWLRGLIDDGFVRGQDGCVSAWANHDPWSWSCSAALVVAHAMRCDAYKSLAWLLAHEPRHFVRMALAGDSFAGIVPEPPPTCNWLLPFLTEIAGEDCLEKYWPLLRDTWHASVNVPDTRTVASELNGELDKDAATLRELLFPHSRSVMDAWRKTSSVESVTPLAARKKAAVIEMFRAEKMRQTHLSHWSAEQILESLRTGRGCAAGLFDGIEALVVEDLATAAAKAQASEAAKTQASGFDLDSIARDLDHGDKYVTRVLSLVEIDPVNATYAAMLTCQSLPSRAINAPHVASEVQRSFIAMYSSDAAGKNGQVSATADVSPHQVVLKYVCTEVLDMKGGGDIQEYEAACSDPRNKLLLAKHVLAALVAWTKTGVKKARPRTLQAVKVMLDDVVNKLDEINKEEKESRRKRREAIEREKNLVEFQAAHEAKLVEFSRRVGNARNAVDKEFDYDKALGMTRKLRPEVVTFLDTWVAIPVDGAWPGAMRNVLVETQSVEDLALGKKAELKARKIEAGLAAKAIRNKANRDARAAAKVNASVESLPTIDETKPTIPLVTAAPLPIVVPRSKGNPDSPSAQVALSKGQKKALKAKVKAAKAAADVDMSCDAVAAQRAEQCTDRMECHKTIRDNQPREEKELALALRLSLMDRSAPTQASGVDPVPQQGDLDWTMTSPDVDDTEDVDDSASVAESDTGSQADSVASSSMNPINGERNECTVCMERKPSAVLLPCKHDLYCLRCAHVLFDQGHSCPACNTPIAVVARTTRARNPKRL